MQRTEKVALKLFITLCTWLSVYLYTIILSPTVQQAQYLIILTLHQYHSIIAIRYCHTHHQLGIHLSSTYYLLITICHSYVLCAMYNVSRGIIGHIVTKESSGMASITFLNDCGGSGVVLKISYNPPKQLF